MIGNGPHEMDPWRWIFDVGPTEFLVLLAALTTFIAVRATRDRPRSTVGPRLEPDLRSAAARGRMPGAETRSRR